MKEGVKTTKILSQNVDRAAEFSDLLVDFIQNDLGLVADEAIPALVAATAVFALMTTDPRQALDEAVALLDTDEAV